MYSLKKRLQSLFSAANWCLCFDLHLTSGLLNSGPLVKAQDRIAACIIKAQDRIAACIISDNNTLPTLYLADLRFNMDEDFDHSIITVHIMNTTVNRKISGVQIFLDSLLATEN